MWEGGEGGEDVGRLDELFYEAAQDQRLYDSLCSPSPITPSPYLHSQSHTPTHSHTHRVHIPSIAYLQLDRSVAPNARFGIVQK